MLSRYQSRSSAGTTSRPSSWPTASIAVPPKIASARGFHAVTQPLLVERDERVVGGVEHRAVERRLVARPPKRERVGEAHGRLCGEVADPVSSIG